MGIAAPQIGISRAAAVVRTPDGELITLLNPAVIEHAADTDQQYEGCLSFFDVRGKVPRPLSICVEHTDIDGGTHLTAFERGVARLVSHEIDHLDGLLYADRTADPAAVIPVEQPRHRTQLELPRMTLRRILRPELPDKPEISSPSSYSNRRPPTQHPRPTEDSEGRGRLRRDQA